MWNRFWRAFRLVIAMGVIGALVSPGRAAADLDTAHFFPAHSGGAQVTRTQYGALLRWPIGGGKTGELALSLQPKEPLITHLGLGWRIPGPSCGTSPPRSG